MDLLKRRHAPITSEGWQQVDDEARRVLKLHMAGRKVVDFSGPHGAGMPSGKRSTRAASRTSRRARSRACPDALRVVQPLVEIRAPFTMKILELDYAARGATDLDLDPVIAVAEKVAHAEDTAIFHGFKEGRITGVIEATPHKPIDVPDILAWPKAVVAALEVLRAAGVNGPYALALGTQAYTEIVADSEDGYPLRRRLIEGLPDVSLVWAPALQGGALLMSVRGGDYELTVGQDLSVGYAVHDRTDVELYITESFTFRVLEEKAAILLRRAKA